jgi:hypothetical protein
VVGIVCLGGLKLKQLLSLPACTMTSNHLTSSKSTHYTHKRARFP